MEWQVVTGGLSDATVTRRGGVYRKRHLGAAREAATLAWLGAHGIPAPEVLDIGPDWFEMAAVPGLDASHPWPADKRDRVVDALADLARSMHALPIDECPFDRTLAVTVAEAARAAAAGAVELDRLDDDRAGWSAGRLLNELRRTRPPSEDLVVTHGDLCVPNVLLDPQTCEVTGVIDTFRAGRADRYVDLAIATRSLGGGQNPQYGPPGAARFLHRYGLEPVDAAKITFYRLLDEFA